MATKKRRFSPVGLQSQLDSDVGTRGAGEIFWPESVRRRSRPDLPFRVIAKKLLSPMLLFHLDDVIWRAWSPTPHLRRSSRPSGRLRRHYATFQVPTHHECQPSRAFTGRALMMKTVVLRRTTRQTSVFHAKWNAFDQGSESWYCCSDSDSGFLTDSDSSSDSWPSRGGTWCAQQ